MSPVLGQIVLILSLPFLLGAQEVGIPSDPCLSFHKTSAIRTPFAVLYKERAALAGVIPFLSDFLAYFAV